MPKNLSGRVLCQCGPVTSSNQMLVGIRLAGVTLSSLNLQSLQALGIYWESGSENKVSSGGNFAVGPRAMHSLDKRLLRTKSARAGTIVAVGPRAMMHTEMQVYA